jgi:hypothetical protein
MLIGLHGKAGSGKDTIYQIIKEEFEGPGVRVLRDAFADRLKLSAFRCFKPDATLEEAYEFFEVIKNHGSIVAYDMHDDPIAEVTGREFSQYYGTEGHRNVLGEDVWVDAVLPSWQDDDYGREDGITRNDILVITDVRFPNEAERILDCGGAVWHVYRPSSEVGDTHISEADLNPEYFSYTIENLTTLDALRPKVHLGVWSELAQQVAS